MGDYEAGRDRLADAALETRDAMMEYLRQSGDDVTPYSHAIARLRALGSDDGF